MVESETTMKTNRTGNMLAYAPVVVGALNWGLVGLFNVDLVKKLTGNHRAVRRLIYTGVGAAGAYSLYRSVKATA